MDGRSKALAERINLFNEEVISFVENCTGEDWRKMCAEDWPVGVTARHIAAGHYQALALAKMILSGQKLPELTPEQITENANRHAREHAGCTKSEVLGILRQEGRNTVDFVKGLDNSQLDKAAHLSALGADISVEKFVEVVVLQSSKQHFDNMKAAVGK